MENIMDRVKTFEDAVKELGEDHPLVMEYRKLDDCKSLGDLAYMKLCIITAALNEGWKPQYTEGEFIYRPSFCFYTKEQIDKMSKDELANVFVFDKPIDRHVGIAYAYSMCVPSIEAAPFMPRRCFKTEELAEYAGKQFIELYADYLLK